VIELPGNIIGPGRKSIFPSNWNETKILNVLEETKKLGTTGETPRMIVYQNESIKIKAVLDHNNEKIVTANPVF
jgi:hypothetical protein